MVGGLSLAAVLSVCFGPLLIQDGTWWHVAAGAWLAVSHALMATLASRESRARLKRADLLHYLVLTLPVSYMVLDKNKRFVFAEGRALRKAAESKGLHEPNTVVGARLEDIPHDPRVVELYERALAEGVGGAVSLISGGVFYYVEVVSLPDGLKGAPEVRAAALTLDVSKALDLSKAVRTSIKRLRHGQEPQDGR